MKTVKTTTTRRRSKKAASLPKLPALQLNPSPAILRRPAAPCSLACAAEMLPMRTFVYHEKVGAMLVKKSLNLSGVEKLTNWKALHDENGAPHYSTWRDEDGKLHRTYTIRTIAEAFLIFARATYTKSDKFAQLWKSCNNGTMAGWNNKNPERLCAMAALWGLDSLEGVAFRTPLDWRRDGYELKDTARPFFVITPKFAEKQAEDPEETTEDTEQEEPKVTGAAGQYNFFPVYCSLDVVKVREIKRRAPGKAAQKAAEEEDAREATQATAAAIAAAPLVRAAAPRVMVAAVTRPSRKAAPAPGAPPASIRQLALAL